MITSPLPLTLPRLAVLSVHLLHTPRCAELTCRDGAGQVHTLRCTLWSLDRLARHVWPRPARIAFLAEVAEHLRDDAPWQPCSAPAYFLPPLAFVTRSTCAGLRYVPILREPRGAHLEKKPGS